MSAETLPHGGQSPLSEPARLSHLDEEGKARMVNVGAKPETARTARATGRVAMAEATLARLISGGLPKAQGAGEALAVARIAAIQAVKQTATLIPLCHPLRITGVDVQFAQTPPASEQAAAFLDIAVTVSAFDRTGVEMEALTVVSVAALTIYDLAKAIDRGMQITQVQLDEKRGGRSGVWQREPVER